MKKDFVKILLIFVICLVFAFGACLLSACLFNRVEPLASAETVTLPDDGVVGENILYNSAFSSTISPLGNYFSIPVDSWYYTTLATVSYPSSGGISLSTTDSWHGLDYMFDSLSGVLTFTMSFSSDVTIAYGIRYYNGSSWVVFRTDYVASSNNQVITSSIFDLTAISSSRFFIFIWTRYAGSFHLDWCKLESGSEFTGYVPNYDEIEQNTLSDYFDYNDGWTNYSVMGDFLHNDSQLQYLSSPNGGSITYVGLNSGTFLSSSSNGTQFDYSPNQIEFWTSNSSHTVAILINGTISSGDVVLSLKYTKYEGVNDFWQGTDPIAMNDQYNLSSGLSIFNYVGNTAATMTLTLRAGVSIYLLAYKVETGSYFTRFPYSSIANQSSFSNGYNAGLIAGTEQGYNQGLYEGYNDGFTEGYDQGQEVFYPQGYTNGYNDGVLTADQGSWSNMLSSLINLPVTFILSLIHFEILGFDFANVFRIIVLFSLLSFIITKVLKGII